MPSTIEFYVLTSVFLFITQTLCLIYFLFIHNPKRPPKHSVKIEGANKPFDDAQSYIQCIIDSMPQTLIAVDPQSNITQWNIAAEKATGLRAEDAIGTKIEHSYTNLPINSTTVRNTIKQKQPYVQESIQQGIGSNATFIDLTVYPLQPENGSYEGAVIMIEDVTMRVRIESMMIQNEKIMSLGELAAGIAHEINNPLTGILNTAQNIQRRLSPGLPKNEKAAKALNLSLENFAEYLKEREIYAFLDQIREGGERAAHIVTNLLEFSRGNNRDYAATNLNQLIEHSLDLAANTFKLKTHLGIELPNVTKRLATNLPPVPCVATEIQQVILNLLKNAAQAFQSEEYGPPLAPEIAIKTDLDKEGYAILEISDNGPGIPKKIRSHIFEPFFTTKAVGEGTGLGLSVSYFIVTEHHNGSIEIDSQPGYGTTFTIRLPLTQPE